MVHYKLRGGKGEGKRHRTSEGRRRRRVVIGIVIVRPRFDDVSRLGAKVRKHRAVFVQLPCEGVASSLFFLRAARRIRAVVVVVVGRRAVRSTSRSPPPSVRLTPGSLNDGAVTSPAITFAQTTSETVKGGSRGTTRIERIYYNFRLPGARYTLRHSEEIFLYTYTDRWKTLRD